MGLYTFDATGVELLQAYFDNTDLKLKLFVNNVTPAEGVSFTECDITGYAEKTLNKGSWTISSQDPVTQNGIPQAKYAAQTFTLTGSFGDTIYGYYVVDGSGNVKFAERVAAPYTPTTSGDVVTVTPVFQMGNGTPT